MYLSVYKSGTRVTSLTIPIHGNTMEELRAYAEANLEYDEMKEQTEEEHAQEIEAENNKKAETGDNKNAEELAKIETEARELETTIKELKDEYILADMQGDEETKEAIRQEYKELLGANNEL